MNMKRISAVQGWLRSPNVGNTNNTRNVNTSGTLNNNNAIVYMGALWYNSIIYKEKGVYTMGRKFDMVGWVFGEWTVLKRGEKATSGNYKWLCKCSCGTVREVDGNSLRSGRSTHCRHCITPHNRTKYTGDPIQTIWSGMKQRCYDRNQSHYHLYGGRGITICDEWINNPLEFYGWAYANGYRKGLSIDRIDNERGYSPKNCRFVKKSEQQSNRRTNRRITINGETDTLSGWCRRFQINRNTVKARINRGYSEIEALTKPIQK